MSDFSQPPENPGSIGDHHANPASAGRREPGRPSGREESFQTERIRTVKGWLTKNLATPPGLSELSRSIGLNKHSLCREFKRETGLTITQFLQLQRVEAAEQLLISGKWSVTEAALEVGYNSLSAFSRAYLALKGHCPCRARLWGARRES